MEKTEILKAFEERGLQAENAEYLEDVLSSEFADMLINGEDAQRAFDELNAKYGGLLWEHFAYKLSEEDESWFVREGDAFEADRLSEYIEAFEAQYGSRNIETSDQLVSAIESRVMKDMDNAGCDAFAAFDLLSADLSFEGEFYICQGYGDPRIEFSQTA